MHKRLFSVFLIGSLISGCGALATHDSAGPVSHHAQRKYKYDEAAKKGAEVTAQKGQQEKKEQK